MVCIAEGTRYSQQCDDDDDDDDDDDVLLSARLLAIDHVTVSPSLLPSL